MVGAAQRHVISFLIQWHKWSIFHNPKTLSSGGGVVPTDKVAAGPSIMLKLTYNYLFKHSPEYLYLTVRSI